MKILFVLINILFEINVNVIQLIYKFDIKFKIHKFIINVDNVQYNLKILVIFFDNLTIIIIETLSNNHISFKFNNINKRLKIIEN